MGKKILSRHGVCKIQKWNYPNFCLHLNGKPARKSTAEKYQKVLGGDWKVWVTGDYEERNAVFFKYLSKQIGDA